ncbi:MAG TPA: hypothetical protein PK941_11015 [Paludibacter sp.]|jgi:hypothetical protein|nr:hypothetical protein [Paludibacter sp.]
MKAIVRYILLISLLSLLIRCDNDAITSRNYPRLRTLPVSEITEEGVRFNAEIIFRGNFEIINYGFVWNVYENPAFSRSEWVVCSGNIQSDHFSAMVGTTIKDSTSYFVRSYVRTHDFTVFGQNVPFTSLGGVAPQLFSVDPSEAYRDDTVTLIGKGFSNRENLIYFDHLKARTISNTDSLIRVIVPRKLTTLYPKIEIDLLNRKSELINAFKLLGLP